MTVLQTSRSATAKVVSVVPATKGAGGYGQNLTMQQQWAIAHKVVAKLPIVTPAPAYYVVRWGDTLYDIARRFLVPGGWPALYAFNRAVVGRNPNLIFPGQVLHFPNYHPAAKPPAPKPPAPRRPVPPPQPAPKPTVYTPPPRPTKTPVPYTEHIVIEGDRLETLAYVNYGGSIYWWVIANANPEMFHPEDDLTPGRIIRIPKQTPSAVAALPRTPLLVAGGVGGIR